MVKFFKRLNNVIKCLTCKGFADYALVCIKDGYYPYTTLNIIGYDMPVYLKPQSSFLLDE